MSQFFQIHPDNPQPRLIKQSADLVRTGAVIVYPTDSGYALGCHLDDKKAFDRLRSIRQLSEKHHFTLVCRDLSELGTYAKVGNTAYRLLKAVTPGPYTFVLPATREVPRRLQQPKRKTIGLRVPANAIATALLEELGEPMVSTTLILPGKSYRNPIPTISATGWNTPSISSSTAATAAWSRPRWLPFTTMHRRFCAGAWVIRRLSRSSYAFDDYFWLARFGSG